MVRDRLVGRAVQVGLGDEAGAQAVRAQPLGVVDGQADGGAAAQDLPDAVGGQAAADGAGGRDAAEHRSVTHLAALQPGPQGSHRAGLGAAAEGDADVRPLPFLVALGVPYAQDHPVLAEPEVNAAAGRTGLRCWRRLPCITLAMAGSAEDHRWPERRCWKATAASATRKPLRPSLADRLAR